VSLFVPTGERKTAPCVACGTVVEQTEGWVTGSTGDPFWQNANHLAPCGLPCLSGGVRADVYRSGQFHRQSRSGTWCPTCAPGETYPKETIGTRKLAGWIRTDKPKE
jgi:hypothetical protein